MLRWLYKVRDLPVIFANLISVTYIVARRWWPARSKSRVLFMGFCCFLREIPLAPFHFDLSATVIRLAPEGRKMRHSGAQP